MKIKSIFFTCLLFVFSLNVVVSQTAEDSIVIAGLKWKTVEIQKGIVRKQVQVPLLYHGVQNINIVEVDLTRRYGFQSKIAITVPNVITSETARAGNAIAAINGSYFDIKNGNSVCYLKVGKQAPDTTTVFEFAERVTGAVVERNGKIKLIPWKKADEKKHYCKKTTILASGPLMLYKGKECDFAMCNPKFINAKHPRSAIGITKDKRLILITVDGRFPQQAEGINIPELTHLIKMLGGEYALNLDGGGSTTLWASDAPENGVLNTPSDNHKFDHYGERKVANIIIIKGRK